MYLSQEQTSRKEVVVDLLGTKCGDIKVRVKLWCNKDQVDVLGAKYDEIKIELKWICLGEIK